ncbi:ATP-binding domain-containing protein [Streptomyces sp. NPDC001668]|uniref:ATP-binding domain-containing protein n=1 Tax=unclassified Streptomyces TaxID=2593676 RepID=UPI0036AF3D97
MLLNEVTQRAFDMQAAFLNDALITLGIKDGDSLATIRPHIQSTVDQLGGSSDPRHVWHSLSQALLDELLTRPPGNTERAPLAGLKGLQARLQVTRPLVPGLTCHQAKGREWDKVGVKLEKADAEALASGLDPQQEDHRSLYVALTRARRVTLAV